jgi:hypothetical protein
MSGIFLIPAPGAGGGTTAEALGTAASDVNVGAASAPSTGQVLTATDATHATWQTPSAGVQPHNPLNAAAEMWSMPPWAAQGQSAGFSTQGTTGSVFIAYIRADKSFTAGNIKVYNASAGTGGGAGISKARFGLYSVASDGAITLMATHGTPGSDAGDTTLMSASNTIYTKALSSGQSIVAGNVYAVAVVVVCVYVTAGPKYGCAAMQSANMNPAAGIAGGAIMRKITTDPTDLPTGTTAVANLSTNANYMLCAITT